MNHRNLKNGSPEHYRLLQRKNISPHEPKVSINDIKQNKIAEYGSLPKQKNLTKPNDKSSPKPLNQRIKLHSDRDNKPQQNPLVEKSAINKDELPKKCQQQANPKSEKDPTDNNTNKFPRKLQKKLLKSLQKKPQQTPPQSSEQLQSKQLITQVPSEKAQSRNTSPRQLLPSKLRSKPLQVTVVSHQNRGSFKINQQNRRQAKSPSQESDVRSSNPRDTISSPRSTQQTKESSPAQMQTIEQRTQHLRELSLKLKAERQQAATAYLKLQNQKYDLKKKNAEMLQHQYYLQNQIELLKARNSQLQSELEQLHNFANRRETQNNLLVDNNQKTVKDIEQRYQQLTDNYRDQVRRNTELSKLLKEQAEQIEQLQRATRELQEQCRLHQQQKDNHARMSDRKLQQMKQTMEYQMQQMQIRLRQTNQQIIQVQKTANDQKAQLLAKDQQKTIKQQQNELLQRQLKRIDELQSLFQNKLTENDKLLSELNSNKQEYITMLNSNSLKMQQLQLDICQRQKVIEQLKQQVDSAKTNQKQEHLVHQARNQLYSGKDTAGQEDSFEELIKSQTQETNRLRSELFSKTEQVYRAQCESEELRQKVRRLQQQLQVTVKTSNSNLKNIKQSKQGSELILKAEIQSCRRRIQLLEIKIKDLQAEVHSKNSFIQTYLVGQTKKQQSSILLTKLQQIMTKK